jgi:hypothetical protein
VLDGLIGADHVRAVGAAGAWPVVSQAMPTGLRKPDGKDPVGAPVATCTSQIAARPASTAMPRSPTLLLEPTLTYSLLPSGLASRFFVQWWLIGPAGRSSSLRAGRRDAVSPRGRGSQHRVGVGHEQARRPAPCRTANAGPQQHRARLGDAVAVGIAQQA